MYVKLVCVRSLSFSSHCLFGWLALYCVLGPLGPKHCELMKFDAQELMIVCKQRHNWGEPERVPH